MLRDFKAHGKGTKILSDAYKDIVQDGTWQNDKLVNGIAFKETRAERMVKKQMKEALKTSMESIRRK